jgi:hypothetical protein
VPDDEGRLLVGTGVDVPGAAAPLGLATDFEMSGVEPVVGAGAELVDGVRRFPESAVPAAVLPKSCENAVGKHRTMPAATKTRFISFSFAMLPPLRTISILASIFTTSSFLAVRQL